MYSKPFFSIVLAAAFLSSSPGYSWAQNSPAVSGEVSLPIGDIEGMRNRWDNLQRAGDLRFDPAKSAFVPGRDNTNYWFVGDLIRRGPFGIRTVRWVRDLKRQAPERTVTIIGNHDVNGLWLIALLPSLELGLIPDYQNWLTGKGLPNTRYNQVLWFGSKYGLNDKVMNFWIELAAARSGVQPDDPNFQSSVTNEKKPAPEKLGLVVSESEFAEEFIRFHAPGGEGFKYLEESDIAHVHDSPQGLRQLMIHSGTLTRGNLGIVPTVPFRYYEKYADQDWLRAWARDLNKWKDTELAQLRSAWHDANNAKSQAEKVAAARRLLSSNFIRYGDAGWDPVANKIETRASSVIYPEKIDARQNTLPGIPEAAVIDLLARARVDQVIGGHIPVGDGAVFRQAYSDMLRRPVMFVMVDTSYSPVEANDRVALHGDGRIEATMKSRKGDEIIVEIPSVRATEESSGARNALRDNGRKIGMVVDGYLIAGFAAKVNADGSRVPDAQNFMLLKQDGYSFEYKKVHESALEGITLHHLTSDLRQTMERAQAEKLEMIKAYGRPALSEAEFVALLHDHRIIFSSGPAEASLKPVIDPAGGQPENLANYLEAWRASLEAIPDNEKVLLLSGGTTGLERMKNEIAQEVNQRRRARKALPFESVGMLTGVTRGSELDPHVDKFFVTKAFYWNDYFTEVAKLIRQAGPTRPIDITFAGGGSIVGQQIREARELKAKSGLDIRIVLAQGITPAQKLSATDVAIQEALKNSGFASDLVIVPVPSGGSRLRCANVF